jgi:hypothetical protein
MTGCDTRPGKGRNRQVGYDLNAELGAGFDRELALGDKLAHHAVIGRIARRPRGVVRPVGLRGGTELMRSAGQRVKAGPYEHHARVARNERRDQDLANKARHLNVMDERVRRGEFE